MDPLATDLVGECYYNSQSQRSSYEIALLANGKCTTLRSIADLSRAIADRAALREIGKMLVRCPFKCGAYENKPQRGLEVRVQGSSRIRLQRLQPRTRLCLPCQDRVSSAVAARRQPDRADSLPWPYQARR